MESMIHIFGDEPPLPDPKPVESSPLRSPPKTPPPPTQIPNDSPHRHRHRYRCIGYSAVAFLALIITTILVLWAIFRPLNPHFTLQDITFYTFNLSTSSLPTTLSTNMEITISSRNPNRHIGIYYENMEAYMLYHGHQITLLTSLPSTYQNSKDVSVWSFFLIANEVPVSDADRNVGGVLFDVKIKGLVKLKVGSLVFWKFYLNVNCPAFVRLGEF